MNAPIEKRASSGIVAPKTSRETVAKLRATYASQLCLAEHELIEAQAEVAKKTQDVEQLRGALRACDVVMSHLPPDKLAEESKTSDIQQPKE
jgi:hypothetical protein